MALRIRLTGRLGIDGEGGKSFGASDLPGRQGRLALAYLALNPHPVTRDELAELIWGEGLPRSWERDLSAVVSKLKALFARLGADDVLTSIAGCYELRQAAGVAVDFVDARCFIEEAELERRAGRLATAIGSAFAAAEIARRPFMPGDEGEWLESRRAELLAVYGRALDMSSSCHRARGEHQDAIRLATRAVEVEPYREAAYVALMRLQLEVGNRAEALRVYERCRQRLVDDLGVPPGPDADAVHREALRADIAPPAPALPPRILVAARGSLVGRDGELERLRDAWARAKEGERTTVFVAGDPGIGKTRLVAELARAAHDEGALVLFGRCDPEPLASYQPFVEALRHWVASASPVALRSHAGPHAAALATILPELAPRLGRPGEAVGAPDRLRLYEAVSGVLSAIARDTRVLVVLDDLHDADQPTLGLLSHLARSGESAPVLLAATYRHAHPEPGHPLLALVGDLRLDRLAEEVLLGGLDADATATLMEAEGARRPDAAQAKTIRERSAGNPLFIRELAHADEGAPLPQGVGDAISRQLRRLPPEVVEPLTPAAVIGYEFDVDVLRAVTELPDEQLVDALEAATRARVLAHLPSTHRYAFTHPLVRENLQESFQGPSRLAMHSRVASALEKLRPDDVSALAHHFLSAGDDIAKAVEYALRSAETAMAQFAPEEAVEVLDRALGLVTDADSEPHRALLALHAIAVTGRWHARYEGQRFRVVN